MLHRMLQAAAEAAPQAVEALAEAGAPEQASELGSVVAMAVLQGLTEFLPVSSSGHLVLADAALDVRFASGALLTVALHVGTLVAVLAIYGKDLIQVLHDALAGRPRELGLILLGSVPAAVVGLGFKDAVESLFERPNLAAGCLLLTALLLLVSDRARRRRAAAGEALPERAIGVADALIIGLSQAFAILPGISRSGSTIATGLLRGHSADTSARFSFLLSLPAIGGAALLDLPELRHLPAGSGRVLMIGFLVSAVVGLFALKLLLVALRKGAFPWFALYCALVGGSWLVFGPFQIG